MIPCVRVQDKTTLRVIAVKSKVDFLISDNDVQGATSGVLIELAKNGIVTAEPRACRAKRIRFDPYTQ